MAIFSVIMRRAVAKAVFFNGSQESLNEIYTLCKEFFDCKEHEPVFIETKYGDCSPIRRVIIEAYPSDKKDDIWDGFYLISGIWYLFDNEGVRKFSDCSSFSVQTFDEIKYIHMKKDVTFKAKLTEGYNSVMKIPSYKGLSIQELDAIIIDLENKLALDNIKESDPNLHYYIRGKITALNKLIISNIG